MRVRFHSSLRDGKRRCAQAKLDKAIFAARSLKLRSKKTASNGESVPPDNGLRYYWATKRRSTLIAPRA
jgi:hypothetical protein